MRRAAGPRAVRGVGLIEVLVAVIVVSIGFLAAASLQIQGMRSNLDSKQRAQALLLVGEMMDRMRNNPAGVAAGSYDDKGTGALTAPACRATGCGPSDLAALDLYEWSAKLRPLDGDAGFVPVLPGAGADYAEGSISDPVGGVYTITLAWQGFVDGESSDQTLSLSFQP